MKVKQTLASLILTSLAISMSSAQVPRGPQGFKDNITFSKTAFDQSLSGALGPKVMGYQYVLIKDGRIVTEKAGGLAQTAKDGGPLNMTTRTPLNIGSLQKFVTGTAMLNMMEHPTKWSPGQNLNLRNRLDMPIWGQFGLSRQGSLAGTRVALATSAIPFVLSRPP